MRERRCQFAYVACARFSCRNDSSVSSDRCLRRTTFMEMLRSGDASSDICSAFSNTRSLSANFRCASAAHSPHIDRDRRATIESQPASTPADSPAESDYRWFIRTISAACSSTQEGTVLDDAAAGSAALQAIAQQDPALSAGR